MISRYFFCCYNKIKPEELDSIKLKRVQMLPLYQKYLKNI